MSARDPNLAHLAAAAAKLLPLLDEIVFVGGCITGLMLTDPASPPVRPTLDVDAIVEISSYPEFSLLENRLGQLGFHPSAQEGSPICRWVSGDLILDLMPTDPSILGFSNRWYRPAMEHSKKLKIADYEIRVVTAPYFVATKLEAFHGRGKNDYRMSHDLEDIITVIDGRPEFAVEVNAVSLELRRYLSVEFRSLLSNPEFHEALPGHLLSDEASQQRAPIIIGRMQRMLEA